VRITSGTAPYRIKLGKHFAASCIAAVLAPTIALAHPHVTIEARAVLAYAPDGGGLSEVRHEWTFDPAYSAFLAMGIPRAPNGTAAPAAMAGLAATTLASLAASDDFTWMKAGGHRAAFAAATGPEMSLSGGRVTLRFAMPLRERPDPGAKVVLEVMDPTYFVAFSFAPGDDAVRAEGAPEGCALAVQRPKGFDPATAARLASGALEALAGATDAVDNRATLTCP